MTIAAIRYTPVPVRAAWTIRSSEGVHIERENLLTDTGLSQLAANWAGQGKPPLYLIISNFSGKVQDAALPVGSTSVTLDHQVHVSGDTSIVLGVGSANQETVTFSAVATSGANWVYTVAATTKSHNTGDFCDRLPKQSDTLTNVLQEVQYDPVAAHNARMKASGSGYSSANASYTMQFYLTGNQAVTDWVSLGLSDTGVVGSGLLHHHLLMGFPHAQGVDVELDVTLTLANG